MMKHRIHFQRNVISTDAKNTSFKSLSDTKFFNFSHFKQSKLLLHKFVVLELKTIFFYCVVVACVKELPVTNLFVI
jgi:hypothetical protein